MVHRPEIMTKNTDMNFHFIVPVWGASYTELFTDICLPMLFTPGNLGIFEKRNKAADQFVILTTFEDYLSILDSISYQRLKNLIQVEFVLIDGIIDLSKTHDAMSMCYAMAMGRDSVIPDKTYFIFLTPDSFWSDGAFSRLVELAENSVNVVMAIGFRVNLESMSLLLKSQIAQSPDNPAIPKSELVRLVIDNIHQLSRSHNILTKSGFLNSWPSHIYWINKGDYQLIAHCFHLHPLMVLSNSRKVAIGTTIDGEYLDNLHYRLESFHVAQTEFFGIELSPAEKNWGRELGTPSIKKIRQFAAYYANNRHWYFFKKRIILNGYPSKEIPSLLDQLISTTVKAICKRKWLLSYLYKIRSIKFIFDRQINLIKLFKSRI